jgi:uncharacterized protein GlcG (DUF336 family)
MKPAILTFLICVSVAAQVRSIRNDTTAASSTPTLTAADVQSVIQAAATSVNVTTLTIAVTDRQGDILGVFQEPNSPATAVGNFSQQVDIRDLAVNLARTGGFFSNDQAPLSSRTVRFISGIHFPNGVMFTSNGALYGIENSNRGCYLSNNFNPGMAVPQSMSFDGTHTGLGIITGKADIMDSNPYAVNPGGVPLFKNGVLVGGVGVAGATSDITEYAALIGAVGAGFGPQPAPPGVVIIGGIALPFVNQKTQPAGTAPGLFNGTFLVNPKPAPKPDPEGDLVGPNPGPVGGLTQSDVQTIVTNAVNAALRTRAMIRLPINEPAEMVIAVADLDGTIIALHRMHDSTIFSIDVAATKARNVIWFTSHQDLTGVPAGTAVTNRTIGFGGQPLFPAGIDFTQPGPFFNTYLQDTANPCTQGDQPPNQNQSGIVFFPGSVPLYKNGVLVGGLGVSGDGVDQDDYVTSQGLVGFEAPAAITADHVIVRGVRLPYLVDPRNPTFTQN